MACGLQPSVILQFVSANLELGLEGAKQFLSHFFHKSGRQLLKYLSREGGWIHRCLVCAFS